MKNKLLFSILGVLVVSAITVGVTYAYYMASDEDEFSGELESGLTSTLTSNVVYEASNLVPLNDNLVSTAISKSSNKCIDKNGYEVCSLYKLTLSNSGASENLYGYVRTTESTYTTDNLKYQVFDSSYTAVTDVMTVSKEEGTTVYFQKNSSNYNTTSNGNVVYYLAIWLHDTNDFQDDDYSKTFNGYVGFEAVEHFGSGTGRIEASLGDDTGGTSNTIINYITNLYLDNKDATLVTRDGISYRYASSASLMNDRQASMEVGEDEGNIRYYGANPNNYIYFNCETYPDTNCELWRIIGIVDGKVKIARDSVLSSDMAWDSAGTNNWNTASLKTYLNGDYYAGLKNDVTRGLISMSTWYLGGYSKSSGLYANDIYDYERKNEPGTTILSGNPPSIEANIGLMYASDYGYATDLSVCDKDIYNYDTSANCKDKDWLLKSNGTDTYQWLITPHSSYSDSAWNVGSSGYVDYYNSVTAAYGVRAVLYLKSELAMESEHEGTSTDPYRISLS